MTRPRADQNVESFAVKNLHAQAHGGSIFERLASRATYWAGTTSSFIAAVGIIVVWLAVGHHFAYSDTWQLVVNTGTTIITFLMVFLIQRAQNRETLAIKIQIAELISAVKEANNTVIDLDDLSETQLNELHRQYQVLSHATAADCRPKPE